MPPVDPALEPFLAQAAKLSTHLDGRARQYRLLDRYYGGTPPFPPAIAAAKMTKAYKMLMPVAEAPWGQLVVDSVLDRLEVSGIRSDAKDVDDAVWGAWQDNQMDSESKLAHSSAMISGRAFALVWPGEEDSPDISLDSSEQMIVQYMEGSRRKRVAALRRWVEDDGDVCATLYRPEAIYKFEQGDASDARDDGSGGVTTGTDNWVPRVEGEEPWPLPNPFGVVPVVELAVNRRLKPGSFGFARGEYEQCLGLIDRINLLTFLGLVVAFWLGFPLRGIIGDRILRDDDGNAIPPVVADAGHLFQLENPDAKIVEYQAADRNNLSIYPELGQLAAITKTPRHYFPLEGKLANLSADAIRADEGGMHAKVHDHKGSLGEGWEDMLRLAGIMFDTPLELSPRAELLWRDSESRSLAERASAAAQLKDILPWQALAEDVLGATQDEIARWEAQRSSDALTTLISAAATPVPDGAPVPGQASAGGGNAAGRETKPPRGNEPRV